MRQRIAGLAAMAALWLPSLALIVWGVPRLPLPFVLILAISGAATLAALKAAYQVRAMVDPSFDPDFGAHRPFERHLLARRRNR
jgi:hypothetical protein